MDVAANTVDVAAGWLPVVEWHAALAAAPAPAPEPVAAFAGAAELAGAAATEAVAVAAAPAPAATATPTAPAAAIVLLMLWMLLLPPQAIVACGTTNRHEMFLTPRVPLNNLAASACLWPDQALHTIFS